METVRLANGFSPKNAVKINDEARSEPAGAPPTGMGTRGLEAGAGHPRPAVQTERTAEGGAEEAEGQAASGSGRRRPGAWGPSVPPKLCGAGTSPLPAEEAPPARTRTRRADAFGEGRPRPAAGTDAGKARAAARLGLGSGSASRAAAAAGGGGGARGRRARPRPRRLAAAGAEAAAAGSPAAGAATLAPGEEPRAPPPRAPEVPARRSGRSRSHPGLPPPAFGGSPPGHAASAEYPRGD
uniref:myristoylated alanine-rich C-kinase substrate-like n=1 Tax=Nyctereutes procyonoides TaxID=34880 RepID=UPI002443DB49|nr:myristoylated alanine-rich C-kinase substrate-like [Nyctereutes procyonoides]